MKVIGEKVNFMEVRDDSMSLVYPRGTFVAFAPMGADENLISGKRYVLELDDKEGFYANDVRKCQIDEDGRVFFVPETVTAGLGSMEYAPPPNWRGFNVAGRVRFSQHAA